MAYSYNQGYYRPKHPEKYKGDASRIVYRSGLEVKAMLYFDRHPDVILWASEEHFFVVPYRDPITDKSRRYFPDFWVQIKNKQGAIETFIIEVKPHKETIPPRIGSNGKVDKRQQRAALTYAINTAKWNAAKTLCESRGWAFITMTEKDLK